VEGGRRRGLAGGGRRRCLGGGEAPLINHGQRRRRQ
jgi:hypothetical protein